MRRNDFPLPWGREIFAAPETPLRGLATVAGDLVAPSPRWRSSAYLPYT